MLEVENVSRRYGDRAVVDGVSFTVPVGEMVGFVGGNGAGKTTTMRMILGLLAAHGGRVLWDGRPITADDRRRIGYMPEERGLYPKQPVLDQLVFLGRLAGAGRRQARERAVELLDGLGLGDRRADALESLSLGNQQRVQVAAALVNCPAALVLDEPFSGLDPRAVDAMSDLLRDNARRGVPILFSSHQLDLVERLCDRLVVLADGRVAASGTPAELRARGEVRHRIRLGGSPDWLHGRSEVDVLDVEDDAVLLRLHRWTTDDLLAEATRRGSVRELVEVRPTLSDVYREVTSGVAAAA
ncbi:ABC transporter ATP-binding protein [Nocardioides sp. CPCC 205120]|uniref:ABC transporter ATP-binding protein n=1 Tax=Nocardioides sp. CPCC 205120 TaxID=3406462 RepID=UPI003B5107EF